MEPKDKIAEYRDRVARLKMGGGEKAAAKQAASGKLIARDRILTLLDEGSFHEYGMFVEHECRDFGMADKALPGDGVITGTGTISGFPVCIYAQDFTVAGGSLGLRHARKITKIMDHAMNLRVPLIGINDSGGARIQEGVNSLAGYGEIFYRNTLASGVIPQISIILGPCAGGAVYSPALTDFVFVVDNISKMFITGPEVIKTVLNEEISMEDLGGARVQAEITGNAHFYAENEHECFEQVKKLVTFIPWNNRKRADSFPVKEPTAGTVTEDVVPHEARLPFDMRDLIENLADDSDFFEVHEHWAANIVVGFARMGGNTVGIIGNQPLVLAGTRRHARRGRGGQGGAVHPVLRLLQHPPRDSRRHARLPARCRPGAHGRHPPRREDPLRLLRGDGAEDHRHPEEGLRWRVHRDVLAAPRRGLRLRVADCGDRGDGQRGRGEHHLPPGDRRLRRPGVDAAGEDPGVQ